MSSDWRSVTAAELHAEGVLLVQDGNHGEYRPRPHEFVEHGLAFIRAADLGDEQVLFGQASRISEVAAARITKGIGRPEDTLLSHKGTVGRIAWAPADCEPFVCSPQTTFWRSTDTSRLNPRYLFAYMRSPAFQRQLDSLKGESDMAPYVSLTVQRTLMVAVPPIDEQRRIAGVIGALDDKIEHNRDLCRRLTTLTELAADALFAQAPVDGWSVEPIGEQVSVYGGATPSTKEPAYWDGDVAFATPKDLAGLEFPILLSTERRITQAGLERISSGELPRGTVLLSSRAPIGYLAIAEVPLAVNQGFIAMVCDKGLPNHFVLQWVRRSHDEIVGAANGTTFLEINKRSFRPLGIPIPPTRALQRFAELADPLHRRSVAILHESERLTAVRNALLPRLISGEIRVPQHYDPSGVLGVVAEVVGAVA
jgi:type I restriction enzyme S subunit